MTLAGTESPGVPATDSHICRRLLARARPYARQLVALFLLDLLASLWVLATPLPLKIAIDSVIGSRPLPSFVDDVVPSLISADATSLLFLAVGLLLIIALFSDLQNLFGSVLRASVGERLVLDFRAELFRHAQRLSLTYHDTEGTADTTYRIQKDAAAVEELLIDTALPLVSAFLTVVLMFGVTAWLDWELALVAAAVAPILLYLSGHYRPRLREQAREVKKLESDALGVVQEVLAVQRVVKAFGQEEREQDRFLQQSRKGMRARLRLMLAAGIYGTAVRLTVAVGTASVLFIGVTHVRSGTLTLGELLLVLAYLGQLYEPLKTISRKAGGVQSQLASAERSLTLLDQAPEVTDKPTGLPIERAAGALSLRNVSFGYHDGRQVLTGVDLKIEPAARLGIVGATGAGKTTLLNLLIRFYDPAEGQLLLDGRDLRDYRLVDLRRQFALVLQDPVLFSASVAENIAYGREGATEEEIAAAARDAHAHEFILRLPQGYDTKVGERGMKLSGGERQRIGLARAFLKDAPILLLDEPTSAVDEQTEAGILEALDRLMRGRTCILITHRRTPLSACDRVLALEDGRLVAPRPEPVLY